MGPRMTDAGHTFDQGPYLSTIGIAYSSFIVAYTLCLAVALVYLWRKRHRTALHIRGFWTNAGAIGFIHIYVAALFIVYPLNDKFKCGSEFWIMNIVFPLGIALFQASNVRLMSYAQAQLGMLYFDGTTDEKASLGWSIPGLWRWFRSRDHVRRTHIGIAMGLILQLLLTFFLFFGSRRFSPNTGYFGQHVGPALCRTGFEWIPSIAWQFLWSWVFGPLILFRTRKIRDTHYWGVQTRLAVFSGLPGAPLWIAFLYTMNSPNISKFNAVWPPAMWFAPGLIVMQLSSTILPILDIWRENRRRESSKASLSNVSISTDDTLISDGTDVSRKSKEMANSYQAFEYHIRYSLLPLLEFSVRRDFTSENLLFLREVRNFKTKWRRIVVLAPTVGRKLKPRDEIEMFEDAARIYFELVDLGTARVPINIDSKLYKQLSGLFQNVKYEMPKKTQTLHGKSANGDSSDGPKSIPVKAPIGMHHRAVVAPWESEAPLTSEATAPSSFDLFRTRSSGSETGMIDIGLDNGSAYRLVALPPMPKSAAVEQGPHSGGDKNVSDSTAPGEDTMLRKGRIVMRYSPPVRLLSLSTTNGYVPMSFDLHLFDRAEQCIKYLVYTNTWKSYIKNMDGAALSALSMRALDDSFVPRRSGRGGMSRITDVELHDLHLELQDDRQMHHGVLDLELGPIPFEVVNSTCAACRRKVQRRMQELVHSAGVEASVVADESLVASDESDSEARPLEQLDGASDEILCEHSLPSLGH